MPKVPCDNSGQSSYRLSKAYPLPLGVESESYEEYGTWSGEPLALLLPTENSKSILPSQLKPDTIKSQQASRSPPAQPLQASHEARDNETLQKVRLCFRQAPQKDLANGIALVDILLAKSDWPAFIVFHVFGPSGEQSAPLWGLANMQRKRAGGRNRTGAET
ncbi:hypothetical protein CI102_4773 [Trichoderma harzianum]|nr:hypothetical protein CI102_4773 [Trichoderma harzianum]